MHGGGGIIPDTIVQWKMPDLVIRTLFLKDVFFSFANYEYPRLAARHLKADEKFTVTDQVMKDYNHFADSIGFKYQSYAQLVFDEFKNRRLRISSSRGCSAGVRSYLLTSMGQDHSVPISPLEWTASITGAPPRVAESATYGSMPCLLPA